MKFTRVFPSRSDPEPCSLTDFIQGTGTNAFIIEAVKTLYEVPNKPENPIEWFRLYFNRKWLESLAMTNNATGEEEEDEDGEEEADLGNGDNEESIKSELLDLEIKLLNGLEVEAQNRMIIAKLEHELAGGKGPVKALQNDDFNSYQPSYEPSKSDMLLLDGGDINMRDSFGKDSEGSGNQAGQDDYSDYPELYFPTGKPVSGLEPETEDVAGEEEESSEPSLGEVEYDMVTSSEGDFADE